MSDQPNFTLLIQRIGAYLEKAKAEGAKEKRELKMAQQAFKKIIETLYGKTVHKCMDHALMDGNWVEQ